MGSVFLRHTLITRGLGLVIGQVAIAAGALAVLALAPPLRGDMLLIPLWPDAPTARLALAQDARLVAAGPGGGMVVRGERDALFWPLLRAGIVTIAAPSLICGGRAS